MEGDEFRGNSEGLTRRGKSTWNEGKGILEGRISKGKLIGREGLGRRERVDGEDWKESKGRE